MTCILTGVDSSSAEVKGYWGNDPNTPSVVTLLCIDAARGLILPDRCCPDGEGKGVEGSPRRAGGAAWLSCLGPGAQLDSGEQQDLGGGSAVPASCGPRALNFPPTPKHTQRGATPSRGGAGAVRSWSCPRESGDSTRVRGQHRVSPAVSPCHSPSEGSRPPPLLPLAGSELGKGGEVEKCVQNAPDTPAQPCVGCEQPPSQCLP